MYIYEIVMYKLVSDPGGAFVSPFLLITLIAT